jgi:hypothetical protein
VTNSGVRTDVVLVQSEQTAIIQAPIDMVDVGDWLFNLPDAEYQRCAPPDHLAVGSTTSDDGRPMSINVEVIGGSLVVQHYVAELHEMHHCHMVSLSDLQTPAGWTKVQVIWDLLITPVDALSCRLANSVISHPTHGFLEVLETAGQTFEQAVAGLQGAMAEHNRHETPLLAASIERKALATPFAYA